MKYEREKKELLAYFYCDQFGGTMAIKKKQHLSSLSSVSTEQQDFGSKPLERIKDL